MASPKNKITDYKSELNVLTGFEIEEIYVSDIVFNNKNFIARNADEKYFIKVYNLESRFDAEEKVLSFIKDKEIAAPTLIRTGFLSNGLHWCLYKWIEMKYFTETPANIRKAAKALSRLHRSIEEKPSLGLKTYHSIEKLILDKIFLIKEFDDELSDRVRKALERVPSELLKEEDQLSLLHGDFGWRNVSSLENEDIVLFDFEHSAIGPYYFDFGKLWDRELAEDQKKQLFLSAYFNDDAIQIEKFNRSMIPVRLWIAAGIFPYTHKNDDKDYERHAYSILENIENMLGEKEF